MSAQLIKNKSDFESKEASLKNGSSNFYAKYPGEIGDSLEILIFHDTTENSDDHPTVTDIFNYEPKTSNFVSAFCESRDIEKDDHPKDEIHIAIRDKFGRFSGTANTILETYEGVSVFKNAKKEDGSNNYYLDVINQRSSYVWAIHLKNCFSNNDVVDVELTDTLLDDHSNEIEIEINSNFPGILSFSGGNDGTIAHGQLLTALKQFEDAETIDVNLLFSYPLLEETEMQTHENKIIEICNTRKDVLGFISAPMTIRNNVATATNVNLNKFATVTSTSYIVFDSSPLYVYDKYQDKYIWIPACGHIAGLCANTDSVAEPWFSPAGYNRGQLLGVTKLGFNPTKTQRDTLYQNRINPIVTFPGQGTVLFGDKTALSRPSAFDRINVRRLFIVLQKAIATAAKFQLFEFNDEFTRAIFRNMVEPFLRDVKGRRGMTDFLVVCDETNNTPEVIDTNRFIADIYIKPARSINFITLNFIATRTGVDFTEIAGASA